jgi:hypothetical protein
VRGPDEPFAATVASALTRSRRSFLFIMERIKIKDRVKAWRGWREYMGLLREQNAMVAIFMQKKRILDTRNIILAWKDQVRCATCCRRALLPVSSCARIGLVLRYKVLGPDRVQVQKEGRLKFWQKMRSQGKLEP